MAVLDSYTVINKHTVTNYHKPGGTTQQKYILSLFWRPEVWNLHHWTEINFVWTVFPLEAIWENSFLESSGFWWLWTFQGFWLQHSNHCLCSHITSSLSATVKSPLGKIYVMAFRVHLMSLRGYYSVYYMDEREKL